MCRTSWKNDPLRNHLAVGKELDAEAVQVYLDWLYTSNLQIQPTLSRKPDAFNLAVLKLWAVANAVEDKTFKSVVITAFFTKARARFWTESVKWAFVERRCDDEVRDFVLTVSLTYIGHGWFSKEGKDWPCEFVRELADVAMTRWKGRASFAELRSAWMDKVNTKGWEEEEEGFVAKSKENESASIAASDVWCDGGQAAHLDRASSGFEKHPAGRQHLGQKDSRKCSNRIERWQRQDMMFLVKNSDDDMLVVPHSGG